MMHPADYKIPLITKAVYIYGLWYPLIAVYPLYLYSCSPKLWFQYFAAIAMDIVFSLVIYKLYPTSFQRPKPDAACLSGKILCSLYVVNYKGLNCMPSMHCSQCFIIIFSAVSCGTGGLMPLQAVSAVCLLAAAIIVSTVLTKQHVLIDMAAAFPLAVVCYVVSGFAV
jgi:hypothetical protein